MAFLRPRHSLLPGLFGLCAAILLNSNACAQSPYVWTDEHGVRQYSDRPPPPSVPDARILRQAGNRKAAPPASAGNATPAAPAPEMSYAEKNAEFQRRRLENGEKERKEAERQQLAADRTRQCDRARDYQRNLQSGIRLTTTDKRGEQVVLSDEQRESELKEARRVLDECDRGR